MTITATSVTKHSVEGVEPPQPPVDVTAIVAATNKIIKRADKRSNKEATIRRLLNNNLVELLIDIYV